MRRSALACDRGLDLLVVAFAAWTVVYHVAVALRVSATAAFLAWAAMLVALGAAAWRRGRAGAEPAPAAHPDIPARAPHRRATAAAALAVVAGVAAAAEYAYGSAPWAVVWLLWILAGVAALAAVWLAGEAEGEAEGDEAAVERRGRRGARRLGVAEPLVVAALAVGAAVLSLFLLGPDADDTYYGHLAAWIGAHGSFPVRDVVFTDGGLPSLYYPPVPAYEPLLGTLSHVLSLRTGDLLYYVVPPLASALGVLCLWRLLRSWRVAAPAVALTVAVAFLVLDAPRNPELGTFFVGRIWQGKVLLLCLLVPLLLALLREHVERPRGRSLLLLGATGVAAVGLSTTAIFLVPIAAGAALLATVLRAPRASVTGFAAAAAYPLGAGVVTLALHGRTPDDYTDADVSPAFLAHNVLGTGTLAFLAMLAMFVGAARLPRGRGAVMAASLGLVVGLLYAPGVPKLLFHATGLGRVLWRIVWAVPVAALVGALATSLLSARRPLVLRALPLVAVAVALALAGTPVWRTRQGPVLVSRPGWKLVPGTIGPARLALDGARPGDVILAPTDVSDSLAVMSGDTTTVSARSFYTQSLAGNRAAHVPERLLLARFADVGLHPGKGPDLPWERVSRALRVVGVDEVCLHDEDVEALHRLGRGGYRRRISGRGLACLRVRAA